MKAFSHSHNNSTISMPPKPPKTNKNHIKIMKLNTFVNFIRWSWRENKNKR